MVSWDGLLQRQYPRFILGDERPTLVEIADSGASFEIHLLEPLLIIKMSREQRFTLIDKLRRLNQLFQEAIQERD